MSAATHITTSGGLIPTAFIGAIREPGSRQREVEPASFAVGCTASALWAEAPKNPAALEETIAPPAGESFPAQSDAGLCQKWIDHAGDFVLHPPRRPGGRS